MPLYVALLCTGASARCLACVHQVYHVVRQIPPQRVTSYGMFGHAVCPPVWLICCDDQAT